MLDWAPHAVHLLARAYQNLLATLSTSTPSVIVFSIAAPMMIFLITAWIWGRREAVKTGAVAYGVSLASWIVLYVWSVLATIYVDHQELVKERNSAIRELAAMKTEMEKARVASLQERDGIKGEALNSLRRLLDEGNRLKGDYINSGVKRISGARTYSDVLADISAWRTRVDTLLRKKPFKLGTVEYVMTQEGDLITQELQHLRDILADPDKWLTRFQ